MAIIDNKYIPYYIKSDAIAVFPCANRTNSYASRFTTQYNLTHLGLPNASWISKVADKTTGATVAQGDKISCVINGYFFEFSLKDAYNMEGNKLDSYTTLLACIDASCPSLEPDPAPVPATEPSPTPTPASTPDPLQQQAQLRALVTGTTQPQALDKTIEKGGKPSLFLGLAIFKGITESTSVSSDPLYSLYSLQLVSSGKYPYIGLIPPMPTNAITEATLSNSAVTTDKIADKAVTARKLGSNVVDSETAKLGTNEHNTLEVSLTGGNGSPIKVKLSGSVGNDDIKNSAVNGVKIANYAVSEEKLSSNAVTTAKIKNANVTTDKIADTAITTAKFASNAKAPYAGIAEKILVNTGKGPVACTLMLDLATGILTFTPNTSE